MAVTVLKIETSHHPAWILLCHLGSGVVGLVAIKVSLVGSNRTMQI